MKNDLYNTLAITKSHAYPLLTNMMTSSDDTYNAWSQHLVKSFYIEITEEIKDSKAAKANTLGRKVLRGGEEIMRDISFQLTSDVLPVKGEAHTSPVFGGLQYYGTEFHTVGFAQDATDKMKGWKMFVHPKYVSDNALDYTPEHIIVNYNQPTDVVFFIRGHPTIVRSPLSVKNLGIGTMSEVVRDGDVVVGTREFQADKYLLTMTMNTASIMDGDVLYVKL